MYQAIAISNLLLLIIITVLLLNHDLFKENRFLKVLFPLFIKYYLILISFTFLFIKNLLKNTEILILLFFPIFP